MSPAAITLCRHSEPGKTGTEQRGTGDRISTKQNYVLFLTLSFHTDISIFTFKGTALGIDESRCLLHSSTNITNSEDSGHHIQFENTRVIAPVEDTRNE